MTKAYPAQSASVVREAIRNRPTAANEIAAAAIAGAPDQAPKILEAARTFGKRYPEASSGLVERLTAADRAGKSAFYEAIADAVRRNPDQIMSIYDAAVKIGGKDPNSAHAAAEGLFNLGRIDTSRLKSQRGPVIPPKDDSMEPTVLVALGVLVVASAAVGVAVGFIDPGLVGASISSFETPEYLANYGLGSINASTAYSRNFTGAGVTIAVIDAGFDIDHPDLLGKLVAPLDPVDSDTDPSPDAANTLFFSHGTHVAGIAAGAKNNLGNHGVAFSASIIPIRIGIGNGVSFSSGVLDAAIDHAVANSAIAINNSYGSSATYFGVTLPDLITYDFVAPTLSTDGDFPASVITSWRNAASAGVISVFAAGNDGFNSENGLIPLFDPITSAFVRFGTSAEIAAAGVGLSANQPSAQSLLPLDTLNQPELAGRWLAVVAVDASNLIADFSNGCGAAKNFCVAAPGVSIFSAVDPADPDPLVDIDGDGYDFFSGTSMAAPHVTGALAVLKQAFPTLSADQLVTLILTTAQDLGAAGVDDVYGYGLIDLDAATAPAGLVTLAPAGGPAAASFSVDDSRISLGPAFGDALVNSPIAVGSFDSFNRVYLLALRDFVSTAPRERLLDRFGRFAARSDKQTMRVGRQTLAFDIDSSPDDLVPKFGEEVGQPRQEEVNSAFLRVSDDGTDYTLSYRYNPAQMFSGEAGALHADGLLLSRHALSNPFFSFFESGFAWSMGQDFGDYGASRVGLLGTGGSDNEFAAAGQAGGALVEHSIAVGDRLRLGVQAGVMRETGTLLGARLEGGFGDNPASTTSFGALRLEARLNDRLRLFGSYSRGIANLELSGGSVLSNLSSVEAENFSLGLVGTQLFRRRDRWGLVATQPLRVVSGDAVFSFTSGYTADGGYAVSSATAPLTPSGREIDVEAFYGISLGGGATLDATAGYAFEPGHVAGAEGETYGIMKLRVPF